MVALAPALLSFVSDLLPYVLDFLRGKSTDLSGRALEFFSTAKKFMETEIEHRLQSAVSEIEEHFPDNGYRELARSAPRDIIRMFNQS
jgi:hypothetical protein